MRSTIFIIATACAVGVAACFQDGDRGVVVVAIATAAVVASMWLAAWCTSWFTRHERAAAGLLAGTGIRMFLPLAAVLGVVTIGRSLIEPRSALYFLPLYLAMLIADTVSTLRRFQTPRHETTRPPRPRNKSIDG